MSDRDKQKALKELFEVIQKGVDLLTNENMDKDLYEAFEKYAYSTIKMVDEAHSYCCYLLFNHTYIGGYYLWIRLLKWGR